MGKVTVKGNLDMFLHMFLLIKYFCYPGDFSLTLEMEYSGLT